MKLSDNKPLSYGIDFGTTNSTIAVINANGQLQKIKVDDRAENPSVMRSIVYVNDNLKFLYGQAAIDAYSKDVSEGKGRIKKTIYTGRFITVAGNADIHGVKSDEVVEELIEFDEFGGGRMLQSLKSILGNNGVISINLFGKQFPIEEIVGGFLKEMKLRADNEIGQEIESVVIGRPVKYVGKNDSLALLRMEKAAKIAGFKRVSFEFEPIAAAHDYGSKIDTEQVVLVFDFGGGTLDVSIVKFPNKEVLANIGLPIGGDLLNSEIFTHELSRFFGSETTFGANKIHMPSYIYVALRNWYEATLLKDENFDEHINSLRFMNSNPQAIDALRSLVNNNLSFSLYNEIDRVKRQLTDKDSEYLNFVGDHINLHLEVTKSGFEMLIIPYLKEIELLLDKAIKMSGLNINEINSIATTGGSSLIPSVRNLLTKKFGQEKIIENDAFTSVASGLALRAREVYTGNL